MTSSLLEMTSGTAVATPEGPSWNLSLAAHTSTGLLPPVPVRLRSAASSAGVVCGAEVGLFWEERVFVGCLLCKPGHQANLPAC